MRLAVAPTVAICAIAPLALGACESTQDKAKKLQANAQKQAQQAAKGLEITKKSSDVKVLDAAVMFDQNGAAVAVELKNTSAKTLVDVPILIDLKGAGGKSVYKNNLPGLDPALTSMPLLLPHQTADWVDDQIQPAAKPVSVKAVVGEAKTGSLKSPAVTISAPKITVDPVSGTEAAGKVVNRINQDQLGLLLYAVARQGNRIVAAGRGGVQKLKAGKSTNYDIFFIGNPKGAQVKVTALPGKQTQGGLASVPTD